MLIYNLIQTSFQNRTNLQHTTSKIIRQKYGKFHKIKWLKEKLLLLRNSYFCYNDFKKCLLQTKCVWLRNFSISHPLQYQNNIYCFLDVTFSSSGVFQSNSFQYFFLWMCLMSNCYICTNLSTLLKHYGNNTICLFRAFSLFFTKVILRCLLLLKLSNVFCLLR